MTIDRTVLLDGLVAAVRRAGLITLEFRAAGFSVEKKADASPVTEADRAAEAEITAALDQLAPEVPIVAEERVAAGIIPTVGETYFLVDALDGTREYVAGRDEFTVNVGLIEGNLPVLGVVMVPATGELFVGSVGEGAWSLGSGQAWPAARQAIAVRDAPACPGIVASRSHRTPETDRFLTRFPGSDVVAAGSSLKFCVLAAGRADLYPRLSPTNQWDTAAGDAILRAAGGQVVDFDGRPLRYAAQGGDQPFLNPSFIASGRVDPSDWMDPRSAE